MKLITAVSFVLIILLALLVGCDIFDEDVGEIVEDILDDVGEKVEEFVEDISNDLEIPDTNLGSEEILVNTAVVINTGSVGLKVRDSAARTDSNVLGSVFDATRFTVNGPPSQADAYTWLPVRLEGWVSGNYLSPAPAVGQSVRVYDTGTTGLRVREGPSLKSAIQGRLFEGTTVIITGGSRTTPEHEWWPVKLEGWAADAYLCIASQTIDTNRELAWGSHVSSRFKEKVLTISASLHIDPDYLMAVMAWETGWTFDPTVTNNSSGATGLLQFTRVTEPSLGVTLEDLRTMTDIEQLSFVESYLRPYCGRLTSIEDLYMAVLWPVGVGKPLEYIMFSTPSIEYSQNQGLDINTDGHITKNEASDRVNDALETGLKPENKG